ncbi:MAG TPA: hypothetical protein VF304_03195, partial [Casimicrobiaceae bacterium]
MARIEKLTQLVLLSAFLGAPAAAHAADAARGSTLWHTTYQCTDCHGANPPDDVITNGSTAQGLLTAIHTVPPMNSRFSATLAQNPTDLADLAAFIALGGVVPSGPDLDQQGLTGSWYEAAESGQGFEIEVYPDFVAAGTGLLQGAWFTFAEAPAGGADHQR